MKVRYNFHLLIFAILLAGGCRHDDNPPLPPVPETPPTEVKQEGMKPEEIRKELMKLHNEKPAPYIVAAGDKFDIKVYDNEELNATGLQVTPDGLVSVGLVGPVKIGGLTLQGATEAIEAKLKKYIINPKVTLIPTEIHSSTFSIVGKVGVPGTYPIRNNTRLTDAIAMAQGFSVGEFKGDTVEMADLEHAFIARKGKVLPVNFVEAIRKGNALHNVPLKHGDYIYIPSTMNQEVYILGEVKTPGYIGYKEGMTLMQAISYANGRLDTTSAFSAVIIRGGLSHPKVYRIYMEDILRGKKLDFPIKPRDIIYVPKGGFSEYNVVIKKFFPTLELLNLMAGPFGNTVISIPAQSGSGDSDGSQ